MHTPLWLKGSLRLRINPQIQALHIQVGTHGLFNLSTKGTTFLFSQSLVIQAIFMFHDYLSYVCSKINYILLISTLSFPIILKLTDYPGQNKQSRLYSFTVGLVICTDCLII